MYTLNIMKVLRNPAVNVNKQFYKKWISSIFYFYQNNNLVFDIKHKINHLQYKIWTMYLYILLTMHIQYTLVIYITSHSTIQIHNT